MSSGRKLAWSVGIVLGLDWLLIALLDPRTGPDLLGMAVVGGLLGSLFAQTTLAASWTALGPGPLAWRLGGSLAWIVAITGALGLNVTSHRGPGWSFVVVIGTCLLGQWLLLQAPLWGLVIGYGLRLRHSDSSPADVDLRDRQFGIRQLIVLTTVIGVLLGLGRAAVLLLEERVSFSGPERPIYLFLGVAAALLSLPLVLGALLRENLLRGIGVALSLMAVMTIAEWRLFIAMRPGGGPDLGHFMAINLVLAGLVLIVLSIVRRCGYRLDRADTRRGE